MRYFRENPELSEIDPRDYAKIEDRMIILGAQYREEAKQRARAETEGEVWLSLHKPERDMSPPDEMVNGWPLVSKTETTPEPIL